MIAKNATKTLQAVANPFKIGSLSPRQGGSHQFKSDRDYHSKTHL